MFTESAYEWSIVTMAQATRSQLSAEYDKKTLFVVQAHDEYLSALDSYCAASNLKDAKTRASISTAVLNYPNMTLTGRMPSFVPSTLA